MPTTSVPATSTAWTNLGVTIDPATVTQLVISCPGSITYDVSGGSTSTAIGLVSFGGGVPYPVPSTLFAPYHSGFGAEYGFACLLLPVGQTPVNAPAGGGTQYTTGVFAPGVGPTTYTGAALITLGTANGAGPWTLWGILSDNVFGDNSGSWSVTATVTDAPLAPVLSAPNGCEGRQVTLEWTAPAGADSYRVYRDGVLLATTTNVVYIDNYRTSSVPVSLGVAYSYQVVPYAGITPGTASNTVTVTPCPNVTPPPLPPAPPPAPGAPTGLVWVPGACEGAQVTLGWNPVATADTYTVWRAEIPAMPYFTRLATGIVGTTYLDATVQLETTYLYAVSAVNAAGESSTSSPWVTVVPCDPCSPYSDARGAVCTSSWRPVANR